MFPKKVIIYEAPSALSYLNLFLSLLGIKNVIVTDDSQKVIEETEDGTVVIVTDMAGEGLNLFSVNQFTQRLRLQGNILIFAHLFHIGAIENTELTKLFNGHISSLVSAEFGEKNFIEYKQKFPTAEFTKPQFHNFLLVLFVQQIQIASSPEEVLEIFSVISKGEVPIHA
jgi:hypothetical protein